MRGYATAAERHGKAVRLQVLQARLASPMPDDRLWGWLGSLLVTAFGAFLRFDRLQVPRAIVFDETYYAKDAWSILHHGVEWNPVSNANALIVAGHTNIFQACSGTGCGEYVVQPEVGKYMIAINFLSNASDQQRQTLVQRLAAGDPSIDILAMDVDWTAEFASAGWIRPWSGANAAAVSKGVLPGPLKTATYNGRLWAAPINSNTRSRSEGSIIASRNATAWSLPNAPRRSVAPENRFVCIQASSRASFSPSKVT